METVSLQYLHHQKTDCIGIYFGNNTRLNNLVKKIKGIKWSQTQGCWYLPLSRHNYNLLAEKITSEANINNNHLKAFLQKRNKITGATDTGEVRKHNPVTPASPLWELSNANMQALEQFMQLLKLKAYSPSTITTYRNEFVQLLKILKNKPVDELNVEDLKRYMVYVMEKEGISENTAHSRLNSLKFYFEQVLGREKFFWEIPRPKKAIKLPKVISEEKILEGLLSIKNLKHKTLLLLAYSAGMRVSEVVSLKITDINSDRMQININHAKGKKDRVVTLSKSLLPILRKYYVQYKPATWLFEGQHVNEHYSSRSAQIVFKDAYKKLRLPAQCSFHSLRHSYATHLLENGTDITYIQKLLGHNDIKTTLRYTQISNKDIGKIESPLDRVMRKKAE